MSSIKNPHTSADTPVIEENPINIPPDSAVDLLPDKDLAGRLPDRLVGIWDVVEMPESDLFARKGPEIYEWTFKEDGTVKILLKSMELSVEKPVKMLFEFVEFNFEGRISLSQPAASSFPDNYTVTNFDFAPPRSDAYISFAETRFSFSWLISAVVKIASQFSRSDGGSFTFVGDRLRYEMRGQRPHTLVKRNKPSADIRKTNSPETRAFFPKINDKSGRTLLKATVKNVPPEATFRWSLRDEFTALRGRVSFESVDSLETEVIALHGGLAIVEFYVLAPGSETASGLETIIARASARISVPQFFIVKEDEAFENELILHSLWDKKAEVFQSIREVVEYLLRAVNVRIFWFHETLPAELEGSSVIIITFWATPLFPLPPELSGRCIFSKTEINIYLGAFVVGGYRFSDTFRDMKIMMKTVTDPNIVSLWITIVSRMLGTIMAHEILHSIFVLRAGKHNLPPISGDIMNEGKEFTWIDMTGIEIIDKMKFPVAGTFIDGGLGGLMTITDISMEYVEANGFIVPPEFD